MLIIAFGWKMCSPSSSGSRIIITFSRSFSCRVLLLKSISSLIMLLFAFNNLNPVFGIASCSFFRVISFSEKFIMWWTMKMGSFSIAAACDSVTSSFTSFSMSLTIITFFPNDRVALCSSIISSGDTPYSPGFVGFRSMFIRVSPG